MTTQRTLTQSSASHCEIEGSPTSTPNLAALAGNDETRALTCVRADACMTADPTGPAPSNDTTCAEAPGLIDETLRELRSVSGLCGGHERPDQTAILMPHPSGNAALPAEGHELLSQIAEARGLRVQTLVENGIREPRWGERVHGFRIPYFHISDSGVRVPTAESDGRQFSRVRLPDDGGGVLKYAQPKGSGVHIFTPAGMEDMLRDLQFQVGAPRRLYLQEGEVKALSMVEAGFPSLAVGGISSFTDATGWVHEEILNAIKLGAIQELVFVGDTDTALNPRFAQAAASLAAKLTEQFPGCLVKVLTLPFSGHQQAKGVDDMRRHIGCDDGDDGFIAKFMALVEGAIPVTHKTRYPALAERLLELQLDDVRCAMSDPSADKEWFRNRMLSLQHSVGENFVTISLTNEAQRAQLVPDEKTFKRLVRERKKSDDISRAKRAAQNRTKPEIYYHRTKNAAYYWPCEDGFTSGGKEEAKEELALQGYSSHVFPGHQLSEIREELTRIRKQPVDFAGELAGYPAGRYDIDTLRCLVIRERAKMIPEAGDWSAISRCLHTRFDGAGEVVVGDQVHALLDWLSVAVTDYYQGESRPSQVMVFVGPARVGKDELVKRIILPLLGGGTMGKPMPYFLGKTRFTDDLCASPVWLISDELKEANDKAKGAMEESIKEVAVGPSLRLEAKFAPPVTLNTFRRMFITSNDDDTSIRYLPPPRANFGDKLIYLKFSSLPLFGDGTDYADHDEWIAAMQQELPAFLHYLRCVHEIEAGRYCRNYRARSYHNPDLVRRIQSQGQPSGLDELIQSLVPWAAADCRHGTCENRRAALVTALELFVLCKTTCPDQLEGLGIRSSFQRCWRKNKNSVSPDSADAVDFFALTSRKTRWEQRGGLTAA